MVIFVGTIKLPVILLEPLLASSSVTFLVRRYLRVSLVSVKVSHMDTGLSFEMLLHEKHLPAINVSKSLHGYAVTSCSAFVLSM